MKSHQALINGGMVLAFALGLSAAAADEEASSDRLDDAPPLRRLDRSEILAYRGIGFVMHGHHGGSGIAGSVWLSPFLWGYPPVGFVPVIPISTPTFTPLVIMPASPTAGPIPPPTPTPPQVEAPAQKAKGNTARAEQLVVIGDRLFRAGNLKRASDRYEQAVHAAPDLAGPRVRLAQVALTRGQIAESAHQIRAAVAAEPDWLTRVNDIESIYAEPADFGRQLARLEAQVLRNPNDRDAWLVLGAELYLSGRTRRAADVFLRLTDRKPDATLSAFLDATRSRPVEPR